MNPNIQSAYIREMEYLSDQSVDKLQLIERLLPLGYANLEDYFNDKRDYLISLEDINLTHHLIEDGLSLMFSTAQQGRSGAFAIDEDCTWAWVGTKEFDDDKAKELGVKTFRLGYNGGTIITSNADFNIALVLRQGIDVPSSDIYLSKMNAFLNSMGFNTHIDNNDILLNSNNLKVAGSAFHQMPKSNMVFMSLSLSDHSNEIKELCPTSEKVPGHIEGLTKQEVEEEFVKWIRPTI